MNGRVYDPELGRFLSPDPFVQFPESTQGYNRYAYVANNPLSYNDPSGHFIQFFIAADMIAAGGVAAVGGVLMAAGSIASAAKGYAAGGLNGMFKSVVAGGVTVGITYGMATGLSAGVTTNGVTAANTLGPIAKAGLIGLGGGLASKAGGGRFGDGFLGGVAGSLTNSYLPESWKDGAHGIIVQTLVGGTVSSLGGGKFANGAVSAFIISIAGLQSADVRAKTLSHLRSRLQDGESSASPLSQSLAVNEQAKLDQVAKGAIDAHNPQSISEDQEYAGLIYKTKGGTIASTPGVPGGLCKGGPCGSNPWAAMKHVPTDAVVLADWHTHGAHAPGTTNEFFSRADWKGINSDALSHSNYRGGYLGTPGGSAFFYGAGSLSAYSEADMIATQRFVGKVKR